MPSSSAEVYEALREAIASGSLRANERLREERVAEALGVSRTPVREALIRLLSEGLIDADGSEGVRVADLTAEDLDEVFTLREVLEPLALRYVAANPDPEGLAELRRIHAASHAALAEDDIERLLDLNTQFHLTMYAMGAPRRVQSFIGQLWVQSGRFRFLALYDRSERQQSVEEHGRLLDHVERRDVEGAVAVLMSHFERPRAHMASFIGLARQDGVAPSLARRIVGNGS
jgi:DNA-binding GntR family transcriptional regulator